MRCAVRVKLHKDFIEVEGNTITVGVRVAPEKGKANEAVVRKIAKHFKVPVSSVRIVSGRTSRKKIIDIA